MSRSSLPEDTERISHGEPTWFVWDEIAEMVADADRQIAPRTLVVRLDAAGG